MLQAVSEDTLLTIFSLYISADKCRKINSGFTDYDMELATGNLKEFVSVANIPKPARDRVWAMANQIQKNEGASVSNCQRFAEQFKGIGIFREEEEIEESPF